MGNNTILDDFGMIGAIFLINVPLINSALYFSNMYSGNFAPFILGVSSVAPVVGALIIVGTMTMKRRR